MADILDAPPDDAVLPVTDGSTARRKVQRSFAQEFLCPIGALRRLLPLPHPTDSAIEDVAEQYDVSAFTVSNALVNRGLVDRGAGRPRIPAARVPDRLIPAAAPKRWSRPTIGPTPAALGGGVLPQAAVFLSRFAVAGVVYAHRRPAVRRSITPNLRPAVWNAPLWSA